jgi:hypothetical protein
MQWPGAPAAPQRPWGQLIGAYRLARQIGEGGMGEVWEAQQLAPVRRTVALKLLKAGMDTRQVLRASRQSVRSLLACSILALPRCSMPA